MLDKSSISSGFSNSDKQYYTVLLLITKLRSYRSWQPTKVHFLAEELQQRNIRHSCKYFSSELAAVVLKGQEPAAAAEPEGQEVAAVLLVLVAEMN
jgi:hypothetical protein